MSETNGNLILDAQNVTKQFGGLTAVSDVTFNVPEKSIVSIIGPNGAGKTTFFNMLTGFYRPTIGRITFAALLDDVLAGKARGRTVVRVGG
jgi:branched-chain amino acid transport system ATP-binding protein